MRQETAGQGIPHEGSHEAVDEEAPDMCGRSTLRSSHAMLAQAFGIANIAPGQQVAVVRQSCTILTTDANELMQPIHERMPVIISSEKYDVWIDPRFQSQEKLAEMLRPSPASELTAYRVSTLVHDPHHDVPKCIEPLP
jgi:putative SOS response-associated peptidase YedK